MNPMHQNDWKAAFSQIKQHAWQAKRVSQSYYLNVLDVEVLPQISQLIRRCDDHLLSSHEVLQGHLLTKQVEAMTHALVYLAKQEGDWEWSLISLELFLGNRNGLSELLSDMEIAMLRMQLKMTHQLISKYVERYRD